jgi:Kef-type K+ transport system membrane component KefB
MQVTLLVGILVLCGFVFGELVRWAGLPRVTGYILAGLLLNPSLFGLFPSGFPQAAQPVVDISLAFITFTIGGSLTPDKLKQTGAGIFAVTVCETVGTFLLISVGMAVLLTLSGLLPGGLQSSAPAIAAFAILLGSLGAPTDPSATLAVEHEYGAKGELSRAILGIAAFDDALGILLFSLGSAGAAALLSAGPFSPGPALLEAGYAICGGLALGASLGWLFTLVCRWFRFLAESEGAYIILILGMLCTGFGTAGALGMDELMTTLVAGVVVGNRNPRRGMIFRMMERYTEELVFLFFFALSAMHLEISLAGPFWLLTAGFVVFRAAGKWLGVMAGAGFGRLGRTVRAYAAGGLIPQGGIVIGLALMLQNQPQFAGIANLFLNVVMGATLVHEIFGPLIAKSVLKRAGEIG